MRIISDIGKIHNSSMKNNSNSWNLIILLIILRTMLQLLDVTILKYFLQNVQQSSFNVYKHRSLH